MSFPSSPASHASPSVAIWVETRSATYTNRLPVASASRRLTAITVLGDPLQFAPDGFRPLLGTGGGELRRAGFFLPLSAVSGRAAWMRR